MHERSLEHTHKQARTYACAHTHTHTHARACVQFFSHIYEQEMENTEKAQDEHKNKDDKEMVALEWSVVDKWLNVKLKQTDDSFGMRCVAHQEIGLKSWVGPIFIKIVYNVCICVQRANWKWTKAYNRRWTQWYTEWNCLKIVSLNRGNTLI